MRYRLLVFLILAGGLVGGCGRRPSPSPTPPSPSATQALPTPTIARLIATSTAALPGPTATDTPKATLTLPVSPTASPSPSPSAVPATTPSDTRRGCALGLGLRQETAPILVAYKNHPGLVMSASAGLSEVYFPQLEGWTRLLGGPSLEALQQKAERAVQNGLAYEGLAYGLETSRTTPEEEWQNLVGSTQQARDISQKYGKLLAMGPGFQLMSRNEDKYPAMVALSDLWVLQTQQLQKNPPGAVYRQEVARLVNLIRTGNPDIVIWAQITFPPDREPNAEEWLAYRESIVDLVDGTYIGVYVWDTFDSEQLVAAIEAIFAAVCDSEQ